MSPTSPDPAQVCEDVTEAISTALGKHEKSIITKWIMIAETIDDNGQVGLWTCASKGLTAWDEKGLLHHMIDTGRATAIKHKLQED